jgi:hypothetical protein
MLAVDYSEPVAGFAMVADYQRVVVSAHCGYACCAAGFAQGLSVVPAGFADPAVLKVLFRRGADFAGWAVLSVQAVLDRWAAPFDPAMFVQAACSAQRPLPLLLVLK